MVCDSVPSCGLFTDSNQLHTLRFTSSNVILTPSVCFLGVEQTLTISTADHIREHHQIIVMFKQNTLYNLIIHSFNERCSLISRISSKGTKIDDMMIILNTSALSFIHLWNHFPFSPDYIFPTKMILIVYLIDGLKKNYCGSRLFRFRTLNRTKVLICCWK